MLSTIQRCVLSASFAGSCLWSFTARAQDPAAAEALFRSAQEAALAHDWETACERFKESNRLDSAPGTILNLARCHEEQGLVTTAWRYYQEAAEKLPEGDRRTGYARNKVEELQTQIPKITFVVTGEVDASHLSLTVNGTKYSKPMLGVPLPFDPGTVEVLAEAPGREPSRVRLSLEIGREISHRVQLGAPVRAASVVADNASESKRSKVAPIAWLSLGGLGAATLVTGGIWAGIELGTASDPDHCADGACDDVGARASRRGRTAVIMMSGGAVAAAVGIGLGAFLLLRSDKAEVAFEPLVGGGIVSVTTHSFGRF